MITRYVYVFLLAFVILACTKYHFEVSILKSNIVDHHISRYVNQLQNILNKTQDASNYDISRLADCLDPKIQHNIFINNRPVLKELNPKVENNGFSKTISFSDNTKIIVGFADVFTELIPPLHTHTLIDIAFNISILTLITFFGFNISKHVHQIYEAKVHKLQLRILEDKKINMFFTNLAAQNLPIDKNIALEESICFINLSETISNDSVISINDLSALFKTYFNTHSEHISFEIESDTEIFNFKNKPLLYQVIYSITSYIIFLSIDSKIDQQKIIIIIKNDDSDNASISFEFNGFPIRNKEELVRLSNGYFETHANLFNLNVYDIITTLNKCGFSLSVSHKNKKNIIIIEQKEKVLYNVRRDSCNKGKLINFEDIKKQSKRKI